jgi:hypothetical protein
MVRFNKRPYYYLSPDKLTKAQKMKIKEWEIGRTKRFLKDLLYILSFLVVIGSFTNNFDVRISPKETSKVYAATDSRIIIDPPSGVVLSAPTDSPIPSNPSTITNKWQDFEMAAKEVSSIYNFPVKVVLAQGALESHHGTSNFCQTRNNCLGIGAFDSNPDAALTFENMQQSIVEYMRLVRKNFPEAWANRDNPDVLIDKLEHNSRGNYFASDPDYDEKVTSMPEWSN